MAAKPCMQFISRKQTRGDFPPNNKTNDRPSHDLCKLKALHADFDRQTKREASDSTMARFPCEPRTEPLRSLQLAVTESLGHQLSNSSHLHKPHDTPLHWMIQCMQAWVKKPQLTSITSLPVLLTCGAHLKIHRQRTTQRSRLRHSGKQEQ